MKKIIFTFIFLLFITVSGFSQMGSIGVMGNYNPYNPSFWGIGVMVTFSDNDQDDVFSHFIRFGLSGFGDATQTYERNNVYNSKNEMTEYWQKSKYSEFFFGGYAFQICFVDFFALRLGVDLYFSYAKAFEHPQPDYSYGSSSSSYGLNFGLTGVVGLVLFPKWKYSISVDVCPGYQYNTFNGVFEGAKEYDPWFNFVMPIRLTVGANF
jgi:hypothetical protein